jgi:hypothetical protein
VIPRVRALAFVGCLLLGKRYSSSGVWRWRLRFGMLVSGFVSACCCRVVWGRGSFLAVAVALVSDLDD